MMEEKHCFNYSLYSQGICFIRISRPDFAVIYPPDEKFEVGVAKVMINTMITHTNSCPQNGYWQQKKYKYKCLYFTRWCASLTAIT